MAWLVSDSRVLASAQIADDRRSRRRGLLGRDDIDGAMVLEPRRWVHTIGMRFDIDVAYLDRDGCVLRTSTMTRHRIALPAPRAHRVIEARAGSFERWGLHTGDTVEVRVDER
ncbi:MAG: DUF192 domain-containing protein [Actinobacteria bacterium]|nr:DUF192 domain-containing protein [Actinomycetota bacterium]